MAYPPPQSVIDQFLAPTSHLYRRVEIYENDGVMPWRPELWDRLVEGSVNVDYGRDERRTLEVTLDNYDGELAHSPTNLWYDKVLKVFYGIHVNQRPRVPSICIIEEYNAPGQALHLKNYLNQQGYTKVRVLVQISTFEQVQDFDIIISLSADYTRKLGILTQAYDAGISVFTANLQSTAAQLPVLISGAAAGTTAITTPNSMSVNPAVAHPLNSGWSEWSVPGQTRIVHLPFEGDPSDWSKAWNSPGTYDTATRYSGASSYRVPAHSGAIAHFARTVDVTPGEVLKFEMFVTGTANYDGTAGNSKIRVADETGALKTAFAIDATKIVPGEWTRITGSYTIPAGAARIQVQLYTDHNNGEIWLDEFSIARTDVLPTYRKITGTTAGAYQVGQWWDQTNGFSPGIVAYERPGAGRWVHLQQIEFNPESLTNSQGLSNFLGRAMEWLDAWEPIIDWETQLGEFMIDGISNNEYDDLINISGRDYTKRCLLSKFANSTGYTVGQNVGTIIRGIAVNAGISKFNLPVITDTLPRDVVYERGVERWTAMKEIADATNYEIYFDSEGFLTMRKYSDPLLTPATLRLSSGPEGNLVSATNKASDSRLFNHVIVTGESSNSQIPPVAAEARNILPSSPSSIQRIGDRVTEFKSNLVTTNAQAKELAETYLRISSLEEFELDFSSILLPWIEPGEILEIEEFRSGQYMPTRYLISSLSFPLDLGPMSGNGKRVTVVV